MPWRPLARAYIALSWAAPPATITTLCALAAGYQDTGPQSQGLGALALYGAAALTGIAANALIAAALGWRVPAARPLWRQVTWTTAALLLLTLCALLALLAGRP